MSINDDTSNPTTVSYGGTVIARLNAGQTANLPCAKKRMKADVKIVAGSGGGSGASSVITDGDSLFIKSASVTREGDDALNIP